MKWIAARKEKYRKDLLAKYEITSQELVKISARGYREGWPTRVGGPNITVR